MNDNSLCLSNMEKNDQQQSGQGTANQLRHKMSDSVKTGWAVVAHNHTGKPIVMGCGTPSALPVFTEREYAKIRQEELARKGIKTQLVKMHYTEPTLA